MVSEELRRIEAEIDNFYLTNPMIGRVAFGAAALHYLKVCEEQLILAFVGIHDLSDQQMSAMADQIINRSKPALQWILRGCSASTIEDFGYDDTLMGHAVNLATLADDYLTIESAFVYASSNYVELKLEDKHINTLGVMRDDALYDAYDRIHDVKKNALPNQEATSFLQILQGSLRIHDNTFSYSFSPSLVSRTLDYLSPTLDPRFRLPVEWAFPDFDNAQFRSVAKIIWAMAFIHLQARISAIQRGCSHLGIANSVLLMKRPELIARLCRYSRAPAKSIESIVEHMTFGECGQTSPDPALQPLINLNGETLALAPSLILNSSIERNLMVLLNRLPDARRVYSVLSRERESLMRNDIVDDVRGLNLRTWYGGISAWNECEDIDLILISDDERQCLIMELKSFIAPAEPKEIINRSEEIAKGIQQIYDRKHWHETLPAPLHKALGIDSEYVLHWTVVSENSIGANYVQKPDVPVVNRRHLTEMLLSRRSVAEVGEWLSTRSYLPIEGADFHEIPRDVQLAGYSLSWYALQVRDEDES